jgi:hypothetical protein
METSTIQHPNLDSGSSLKFGQSQDVVEKRESSTPFKSGVKIPAPKEVELELEFSQRRFLIEPGVYLEALQPLRLAYNADTLEVVDWGIAVALEEHAALPHRIAQRFLEMYSKAQHGFISDAEALQFSKMCAQVDYRAFCAARRMPEWREATLVRHQPACYINLGYGSLVKLAPEAAQALKLLEPNTYFGAWFTVDREGTITRIQHAEPLPPPVESLEDLAWQPASMNVEVDPELTKMLPDPASWSQQDEEAQD